MNETIIREKKAPKKINSTTDRKPVKNGKVSFPVVSILLTVMIAAVTAFLWSGITTSGASALFDSYNTAYASEKTAAYQAQYQKYFEKAEKAYHVANHVTISIGDLREQAKLEVLRVSDVEYIIETSEDNSSNISSWLEVPGQGTYIVDLQAAEFIVDDERSFVLVRLPYPELSNISIDYANVKKLFFKNDLLNDSYRVGEDLARQQLSTADLLIKKEFASNQSFYRTAQEASRSTIQYLVKQLNPGVTDLVVEVDFN